MKLDSINKFILKELQENARISNLELANRVGLSPSACSRRLEQLEETGVIEGYQAVLDNKALGQSITAIVQITLHGQSEQFMREFEEAVCQCPHVVACFLMSGASDYIVRVNARDMEEFQEVHTRWLSTMPHVSRIQSSFSLRNVVNRANVDISMLKNV